MCLYQVPIRLITKTVRKLRHRYFFHRGQKPHDFVAALQNLWKHLEKKDVHGCADINASDKLPKDMFVVRMETGRRMLKQSWL